MIDLYCLIITVKFISTTITNAIKIDIVITLELLSLRKSHKKDEKFY